MEYENGLVNGAYRKPTMKGLFRLLGSTVALEILVELAQHRHDVSTLADRLQLDMTTISKMLKQLSEVGMVLMEREKTRHVYGLGNGIEILLNGTNISVVSRTSDGADIMALVPRSIIRR